MSVGPSIRANDCVECFGWETLLCLKLIRVSKQHSPILVCVRFEAISPRVLFGNWTLNGREHLNCMKIPPIYGYLLPERVSNPPDLLNRVPLSSLLFVRSPYTLPSIILVRKLPPPPLDLQLSHPFLGLIARHCGGSPQSSEFTESLFMFNGF